jgi:hypothetical protein
MVEGQVLGEFGLGHEAAGTGRPEGLPYGGGQMEARASARYRYSASALYNWAEMRK